MIGAGPCGLGAALGLAATIPFSDWQLVESSPVAGGLSGSVVDPAGFTWDFGGHVTFSRDNQFLEIMTMLLGECGWNRLQRYAWAIIGREWVEYPVQQHWPHHRAPLPETSSGGTLQDWALSQLGSEVTEAFFRPYNEKLWRTPLDQLGSQWVQDRVARPARRSGRPWGPNAQFWYPTMGGAGAPWRRLAEQLKHAGAQIRYGCTVTAIDLQRKTALLDDKSEISFGMLISTMPLDRLVKTASAPSSVRALVRQLIHTRVTVVGIGLEGAPPTHLPKFTWLYFPDADVPFYRLSQLSAYAATNTPGPTFWSLLAECSSEPTADRTVTPGDVLGTLYRLGIVGTNDRHVSAWHTDLSYGYPIPTPTRDTTLGELLGWFHDRGCFSRGRFGDWAYETSGQDQSFQKGLTTALRVAGSDLLTATRAIPPLLQSISTTPPVVSHRGRSL